MISSLEMIDAPVRWMLVQLGELPVDRVDVHVVVLLKVLRQQLHRVVTSMQTSLALKDFLHLQNRAEGTFINRTGGCERQGGRARYPQTLLGSEEGRGGGVVFVELQQHVLQPVSHPQRELHQLAVPAGRNVWTEEDKRPHLTFSSSTLFKWQREAHVCTRPCSPGGVGGLASFPPGCI